MVGLKPVMKSRCRSWLLKKRLSLYSSDTEIEGVSVTGPRWAGGARSPNNSSGYAPTGGRWRPGAGSVTGGGCSAGRPGGGSWPRAWDAIKQIAIPTIDRPHARRRRTVRPDYRAEARYEIVGTSRLFTGSTASENASSASDPSSGSLPDSPKTLLTVRVSPLKVTSTSAARRSMTLLGEPLMGLFRMGVSLAVPGM